MCKEREAMVHQNTTRTEVEVEEENAAKYFASAGDEFVPEADLFVRCISDEVVGQGGGGFAGGVL
jgi:hypothetical protein